VLASKNAKPRQKVVPIHATNNLVEANALAARLSGAGFQAVVRTPESALATVYLGTDTRLLQHYVCVPRAESTQARVLLAQLLADAS